MPYDVSRNFMKDYIIILTGFDSSAVLLSIESDVFLVILSNLIVLLSC